MSAKENMNNFVVTTKPFDSAKVAAERMKNEAITPAFAPAVGDSPSSIPQAQQGK